MFYGWIVVSAAALGMFSTAPGQTFNVAVFVDPMRTELGISRTEISAAYSIAGLAAAVAVILLGRVIDRIGGRRSLVAFGAAMGLVCLGMSQVDAFAALVLGLAALRTLGPGGLSLASSVLASQWFIRRRGRALSLTLLGMAISQALLPPLELYWIEAHGWRATWVLLGLLVLGALVLPAALLARDRPEDVGLRPDGEPPAPRSGVRTERRAAVEVDWSPRQAARTPIFWLLLLTGAIPSLVTTGISFHQVSYLTELGLESSLGLVFPLLAATTAGGTALFGPLVDRVEPRRVLAGLLALLLVGVVLLVGVAQYQALVLFYPLVIGMTSGGLNTTGGVIWASYFGRRHLGTLRGLDGAVKMIAAAFGPLPLALARDQLGSYGVGLVWFGALAVLGVLAALGCRRPDPDSAPGVRPSHLTRVG